MVVHPALGVHRGVVDGFALLTADCLMLENFFVWRAYVVVHPTLGVHGGVVN